MKNGPYELVIAPNDYPGKRYRDKYCYEHHLVWWENTGELPLITEEIHHKNSDKRDNRFENLEKLSKIDHRYLHGKISNVLNRKMFYCANCHKQFYLSGSEARTRLKAQRKIRGDNASLGLYCSQKCHGIDQQKLLRDRLVV